MPCGLSGNACPSEEDSRVFEARKDSDSVLVIDPLDGTKEFIKGRDEFAVNIALCTRP
ncbi:inositol monophosphatase family protein [Rhizobium leguminosarum]|uniref:inositol monophosphatase family protein n=1 Tax=Rhizobium leguminosarum TaxID=384 RepID=UPI0021BC02D1|nr:inositol monophosphatase family protein [Rhizobium leguminosarum]